MDEPFGALDAQTREVMQDELSRIQRVERQTMLFVTHSIREAVYLADRVVVMTSAPGRVKQMFTIKLPESRDRFAPEFTRARARSRAWSRRKWRRCTSDTAPRALLSRVLVVWGLVT